MKTAVIVHGWGANSTSNWFFWLAEELKDNNFKVIVPDFPNTQTPQLVEWLKHFKKKVKIDKDTILIGHSLGVPLILRFLEKLPKGKKIKAAFLISGFERSLGVRETDNFVVKPFNWEKIRNSCDKFIVINSDNDPYIPISIAEDLAKSLKTHLIIEPNAGHINAPGGYLSYPRLLNMILNLK